MMAYVKPELAA